MIQQSPDPTRRGRWSASKILLVLAAVAVFLMMLTWDRGHFQHEQPTAVQKPGTK